MDERDLDKRRGTTTTMTSILTFVQQNSEHSWGAEQSEWELLMRKFSKDYKTDDHYCNVQRQTEGITCESRPLMTFTSGSTYQGTWDELGMSGYGTYTFPNGVVYEGEFADNMFHGNGQLHYPDGNKLRGKWNCGELIDRTVIFADNVRYDEDDWKYCKAPDRRFSREFTEGIQPGRKSFMTNDKTLKDLPDGMYDTTDGVFQPESKTIFDHDDHAHINRFADEKMKKWIEKNCRNGSDAPLGPQPELYKHWQDIFLQAESPPAHHHLLDDNSDSDIFEKMEPSTTTWKSRLSSMSSWGKRLTLKFFPDPHAMYSFREKSVCEPKQTETQAQEHRLLLRHSIQKNTLPIK